MKILHLNLKKEYFNEIKDNKKHFEYRLYNDYWIKRLVNKHYDEVHFKLGYPKNNEGDKIIKCKYFGYEIQEINHTHFSDLFCDKIKVFVIKIIKK